MRCKDISIYVAIQILSFGYPVQYRCIYYKWFEWSLCITFQFDNCILSENWSKIMVDKGCLLYFRWLELLVEPRKDSGQDNLVVLSNHHRHLQTLPRLWPGKPSF
jgi:hypothetical protein